jgi:DUF2892 family protein
MYPPETPSASNPSPGELALNAGEFRRWRVRFLDWMSSPPGRALRVLLGLALIVLGLSVVHGMLGAAIAVFGLVPLTTAILGVCPIRPLVTHWRRRTPVQSGPQA